PALGGKQRRVGRHAQAFRRSFGGRYRAGAHRPPQHRRCDVWPEGGRRRTARSSGGRDSQADRSRRSLIPVNGQEELMGLKLIVVLASGRERDERAINFGAQMAVEHDAKVEILPVYSDSAADMIAMGAAVGAALSQTVIDEASTSARVPAATLASLRLTDGVCSFRS